MLSLVSCTDEIAPEAKNSEKEFGESSEAIKFKGKAMRLINNMDKDSSFILHKEGSMSEACEIASPALGFKSRDYTRESSSYNVNCILEAEEYDLWTQGIDFDISIDENLCEYVQYQPFAFLQYQPGNSNLRVYDVKCDTECAENLPSICNRKFRTADTANVSNATITFANIGTVFSNEITGKQKLSNDMSPAFTSRRDDLFIADGTNDLICQFDYTQDEFKAGPNCDEGQFTTYPIQINSEKVVGCSDPGHATEAACLQADETWAETLSCGMPNTLGFVQEVGQSTSCGGDHGNCINGPIVAEIGRERVRQGESGDVYDNTNLDAFSKTISYGSIYEEDYYTNMYLANYSRVCSSTSNTKTNAQFDTSLNAIIGHEVELSPRTSSYPSTSIDFDFDGSTDFTVLGSHSFDGYGARSVPYFAVKPYYAIKCLDQAFDVKAQIRLFVREWDRKFTKSNPFIGRLSDINQTIPLMDADGEQISFEAWNDIKDWDDFLTNYDRDLDNDYDGDGNNIDNIFTGNQCTFNQIGACFTLNGAHTDADACRTNFGRWIGGQCFTENVTYTDEEACQLNSGTWYMDTNIGFIGRHL